MLTDIFFSEQKFLRLSQFLAFIFLIHSAYKWNQIDRIENTQNPREFLVVDKSCYGRNSFITIMGVKGENKIPYHRGCYELEIGGSVFLYYDRQSDMYYIPNSPSKKNLTLGLIGFLVWSIIP